MHKRSKDQRHGICPAAGVTEAIKQRNRLRRGRHGALTTLKSRAFSRNDLLPELKLERVPLDRVGAAKRRVRKDDPIQLARVCASIEKFGVCQPVLIDRNCRVVHGHVVVAAARKLRLSEIPAIVVEHLAPPEIRLMAIALNRLGERGQWDDDALREELLELIDLGEDILFTGFDAAELDALLLDDGESDDELLPALPRAQDAVSRAGDLWLLGPHRLLQGDARAPESYERVFNNAEKAHLVLTDEPYNVPTRGHITSQRHHREFAMAAGEMSQEQFAAFNQAWMRACIRWLFDGSLLATFIDWRSVEIVLAAARELGLDLLNVVVWVKANAGQGSLWRSQHELLPIFKYGSASHRNNVQLGRTGRYRTNVWMHPGASSPNSEVRDHAREHPTVKPCALLEDALLDVTSRGDVVLDPFAGSGSMLIAAEKTGRICRAIEIDSHYCDVVVRRWQAATGADATLEESGETFAQVEARRVDAAERTEP